MTYLLSLDQGTTSTRAMIFNGEGVPQVTVQKVLDQSFPNDGWVEHDAEQIWQDSLYCLQGVIQKAGNVRRILLQAYLISEKQRLSGTNIPESQRQLLFGRIDGQLLFEALCQDKDLVEQAR